MSVAEVFLCYSRRDQQLAQAVQRALTDFDRTALFQPRVRVRDFMSPSEDFEAQIRELLRRAEYLVLIASQWSAKSRWVELELAVWLETHSLESVLVVLADGELVWDGNRRGFDRSLSTALPPMLLDRFSSEPLWSDLRWASTTSSFRDRYQFRDVIAGLSAAVRGVSKDHVLSADLRRLRRLRVSVTASIAMLSIAAGGAAFLTLKANETINEAQKARLVAASANQVAAQAQAQNQAADRSAAEARAQAAAALEQQREAEAQLNVVREDSERARAQLARATRELMSLRKDGGVSELVDLRAALAKAENAERQAASRLLSANEALSKEVLVSATLRKEIEALQAAKLAAASVPPVVGPTAASAVPAASASSAIAPKWAQDFLEKNWTTAAGFAAVALVLLFASSRFVLMLLQSELPFIRALAVPFYLTPIGRWRLYRSYLTALKRNRDLNREVERYVDLPYTQEGDQSTPGESLSDLVARVLPTRHLALIAGGGCGKTMLCHQILQRVVRECMEMSRPAVPVLVEGLAYEGNLVATITQSLKQRGAFVNTAIVESQLSAGRLLIIFDGWSEVRDFYLATQDGKDVPSCIRQYPDVRFIFSSRADLPLTLGQALSGAVVIKPLALTSETMAPFLSKYLTSRQNEVDRLVDALHSSLQLLATPLMLRLVAEVFEETGDVPRERIGLFDSYIRQLCKAAAVGGIDISAVHYIAKKLTSATYLASGGNRGFPVHRGVEILDQMGGILKSYGVRQLPIDILKSLVDAGLYRRSADRLRCFHDSIESYFASQSLFDQFGEQKLDAILACQGAPHMQEPWEFLLETARREGREQELLEDVSRARLPMAAAVPA